MPTAPPPGLAEEAADVQTTVAVGVVVVGVVVMAAKERGLDVIEASGRGCSYCGGGGVSRGKGTEQHPAGHCACTDCANCQATDRR